MSKAGFSIADLQQGAKKLEPPKTVAEGKDCAAKEDESTVRSLEDLYDKYDGDLDLIFGELKADPSKAKKPHHKPKDKQEFARQYLAGYYSIIGDDSADAKSHK